MNCGEEEKEKIRKIILLNGNQMEYRDLIHLFTDGRDLLDELLEEMNVDGDLYEPRFGEVSVVV